jgi:hypothetical protein
LSVTGLVLDICGSVEDDMYWMCLSVAKRCAQAGAATHNGQYSVLYLATQAPAEIQARIPIDPDIQKTSAAPI